MKDTIHHIDKTFGTPVDGVTYTDRIGVYGIAFSDEGNLLVIRTTIGHFLPGGGLESGESHEQCLRRELMEETGYEVMVERYIETYSLYHIINTERCIHGIGHFYLVKLGRQMGSAIDVDHELVWLQADGCAERLLLEHQAWAVRMALKG